MAVRVSEPVMSQPCGEVQKGIGKEIGSSQSGVDVEPRNAQSVVVEPDIGGFLGVGVAVDSVIFCVKVVFGVISMPYLKAVARKPGIRSAIQKRWDFSTVQMDDRRDRACIK
jgi:hypothetical protein